VYADSHVHLQPHGEAPPMTRERIELYVEAGRAQGVGQIAITEHLFRFREAFDLLYGWWDVDRDDPALRTAARAYWEDHVSGSIADYVRTVEACKSAGLPVTLGLEMDWLSGRAEELRRFLAPYDWDIVLGSVHWIGAWGIDELSRPLCLAEWERRDSDTAFAEYASLLRDLASAKLCDVLAHPDLPKIAGHRPTSYTPLHSAIVESAIDGGCAVEVNANGYKRAGEPYPALPVLERAREAGLKITFGSDAHMPERLGQRFDELAAFVAQAGYQEYVSFEQRRPLVHALEATAAVRQAQDAALRQAQDATRS
jgi:histidinol-phosphatase (PHP family)